MTNESERIMYKFLRTGLCSESGNHTWEIGKWYTVTPPVKMCSHGFHASHEPLDAFRYVHGEVVAEVEVRGESESQSDKECWSEMRIVKAYEWTKEDSVSLAVYAAEVVLHIYERDFPNDDRPRKAIEAAKEYLTAAQVVKDGKTEVAETAWASLWAARASTAASASAAGAAAAWAAWGVAREAWTAGAAAASAAGAAGMVSNASLDVKHLLNQWMRDRIKNKTPI